MCGVVQSLCWLFSLALFLSSQSQETIRDMGSWENGVWLWKFKWRRPSFVWEEDLHSNLLALLANTIKVSIEEDS
jgi:hypothetical protein